MRNIVDTVKMRQAGEEIIKLTEDLGTTIDFFFDRINNMPLKTREWVGPAAVEFVQRTNLERNQYTEFRRMLHAYGTHLIEIAALMEVEINRKRRSNG